MHILVTGFEPFGGESVNASWEAVKRLPASIAGCQVSVFQLPVDFERAAELTILRAEILEADAILGVGVAGTRTHITPELFSRNLMDARIPDNAGFQPSMEPIEEDGPTERRSTLSPEAITKAMTDAGIPAEVSRDAGTYVCNDLFYRLLSEYEGTRILCGFLHVPPQTVMDPGLVTMALEICVKSISEMH